MIGQISGNQIQGNNYSNRDLIRIQNQTTPILRLTDSTFIIKAKVLKNIIADEYVAVFGVADTAKTVELGNKRIDDRIDNFIKELKSSGVNRKDIYIDLITQTQIYDYELRGNLALQYLDGFEIKKNVIIKFSKIQSLNEIVRKAAKYRIYDIVKVDYNINDIQGIYSDLFKECTKLINRKKELYVSATMVDLYESSQIYGESFYHLTPKDLYKSYTSNVSSIVYNSNRYTQKKDLRKTATYYFDKLDYSGFDHIINPVVTEPVLQFILELQFKYEINND